MRGVGTRKNNPSCPKQQQLLEFVGVESKAHAEYKSIVPNLFQFSHHSIVIIKAMAILPPPPPPLYSQKMRLKVESAKNFAF